MTPTQADIETARKILVASGCDAHSFTALGERTALALTAARTVPEGYCRVGTEDRKVLGTLPMTKDGCVIGNKAKLWKPDATEGAVRFTNDCKILSKFYSTRAAAESAKDAEK